MSKNPRLDSGPPTNPKLNQVFELKDLITDNENFRQILGRLPLYARSDLPVLLTGEPGTGKELVARAICAL